MPSSVARLRSALATSVVRRSWAIALHLVQAHVEAGHRLDGAALRMVMLSCSKSVQWARTLKILEEPQPHVLGSHWRDFFQPTWCF